MKAVTLSLIMFKLESKDISYSVEWVKVGQAGNSVQCYITEGCPSGMLAYILPKHLQCIYKFIYSS